MIRKYLQLFIREKHYWQIQKNENYKFFQDTLKNNSNEKIGLYVPQYQLTKACKPKHIIVRYDDIES